MRILLLLLLLLLRRRRRRRRYEWMDYVETDGCSISLIAATGRRAQLTTVAFD